MTKHTEEETFNRLRRSSFETVRADLCRDILSRTEMTFDEYLLVLATHGWTYYDYVNELIKRSQQ